MIEEHYLAARQYPRIQPRHIPRRLRKRPTAPRYVITSTEPVTRETAELVKAVWRKAARNGDALVVDGTRFDVKELPR